DHDLKRLLAYHSVENVGIIVIGIGVAVVGLASGNAAVAALALTAALFHTINHGLFKGLLFLGAGTVIDAEGTADLERLGGVWARLVWTAPLFLIGCAAIAGLPPFNGFASEWMTFQSLVAGLHLGTLSVRLVLLASIAGFALTGGLAAACFVKVFGVVFLGRARRALPPATAARERVDASTFGLGFLAALCTLLGLAPMLAVAPLERIAAGIVGGAPIALPALPTLPLTLAIVPLLGAVGAAVLAARRGVRRVSTWTCGSPVTAAAQYTATAFSKPLRTIFAFVLFPERRRVLEAGTSPWFPLQIRYRTESRYVIDEVARRLSGAALRLSRRTRALQSGSLRLYVAYALAALVLAVALAR
ncbi:MAG: proton-conducting transporter transmembrane domain-containing protein, partial [Vulcanimicrobiaceae bacterium]